MILVTGATGNVGREAIDLLLEDGNEAAGVTRNPDAANLPDRVHLIHGDPSEPATLGHSFEGIQGIILSPRTIGETAEDLASASTDLLSLAAQSGVEKVVVLSAVTVEGYGYRRFVEAFRAVEDAAAASGLEWTVLRSVHYSSNALVWGPQIQATGIVRGALGDAITSPIHPRDIAAVAIRALLHEGYAGQTYRLTGPEALTQRDQVAIIGEVVGREVTWEEISPEESRTAMLAQGVPEDIPDRVHGSLTDCLREPILPTPFVPQILGRPALPFAAWVAKNAGFFTAGSPAGDY